MFPPVTAATLLTPDQERWAEAMMVRRLYADRAELHVAERIGALALLGDMGGVERWRDIAVHLDRLLRPGSPQ